ncbi:MAG: hypothetical protein ACXACX_22775, partial [Candidatus Hodarchaeales archaeon]
AFELLDALRETVMSRFPGYGSVCVLSYMYKENDPMTVLYEKELDNERVYSSKASTFDVNILRKKNDFSVMYSRNPEKAQMTYECISAGNVGGYVTKKYMINHMFDPRYENPIKGDLLSIIGTKLSTLQFKSWFKGTPGRIYTVHVDMAKGKVKEKGDAAALVLSHAEKMLPKVDERLRRELAKEGVIIELPEITSRKGIIVDLAVQIVAVGTGEVEFEDVRNFIFILMNPPFDFRIAYVTYDGWQSTESIQIFRGKGVDASILSVDKNNEAYDSWKDLAYQQLVKCYPHAIANREARELVLNDLGKVDHPEKSWEREKTEGVDKGSKDIMDGIAGTTKTVIEKIPLEPDVTFY